MWMQCYGVMVETLDCQSGNLGSIPGAATSQAVSTSGVNKFVAVAGSGWLLLKIASVSAYGCTNWLVIDMLASCICMSSLKWAQSSY